MGTPTMRRYIKVYPVESLTGSIRHQLTSAERGVWYDLLCFASVCNMDGQISDRDGKKIPKSYIANRLNITSRLLEETLEKCKDEGRITEKDGILFITNWKKYQSEYERQKKSRTP